MSLCCNLSFRIRILTAMLMPVAVYAPCMADGQAQRTVVADSATRHPLQSASIFDCKGNGIGLCDSKGRIPYISPASYPITIRHLGFKERTIRSAGADTVFMQEIYTDLPEVTVESRQHKVLHLLAYVREYSTLSTYSDTVFLFREKMVDYMLTPDKKMRFKGWTMPRVLKAKSYYRFTDSRGTDSVSDKCNHHFSWSDWMGLVPTSSMPAGLNDTETGSDTISGKYTPTEIWTKDKSKVTIDINVMADTTSRKWVPNLSGFFRNNLDFETFRVRFTCDNVAGNHISPADLTGYSFNIESRGRGREMFMFNRRDEPFFVSTYAEVYILDKEYITVKEAKKWDSTKFNADEIDIIEPAEAPELQAPILNLIARVNAINHDNVRLDFTPDYRLVGRGVYRQSFGNRVLSLLKQLTGITYFKSHRNFNNRWSDFRKEQVRRNKKHHRANQGD